MVPKEGSQCHFADATEDGSVTDYELKTRSVVQKHLHNAPAKRHQKFVEEEGYKRPNTKKKKGK